ncbi:MAG: DUF11 domain-containing protein [Phycisphaeraceae bacterium]|nr:DUF11 domain-containing protein [Phycisphaeraceae bacterium]
MKGTVMRLSGGLKILALSLGMCGMLMGCQSSGSSSGSTGSLWYERDDSGRAPAPMPVSEPVKTSAPAKPSSANAVYYPTGHEHNAALLVERMYPSEVVAGQPFEYSIKVTNVSPTTLDNVVVDEVLPTGFTFTSSTPDGARRDGGVMSYNLGSFSPGQSKTITIKGNAGGAGTIESCARVYYTLPVCQTINVVAPALQVTKTAPSEVLYCDTIPVKIVVTNTGTGVARSVVVKDELPAGLKTTDGKSVVELAAGDLGAGQSKEFAMTLKADKTGSYRNSASAASSNGLSAKSNETTTVVRQPVLEIAKKGPARLFAGRPVTFEITVSNKGDAAAASTVIEDPIPAGATFVSATDGGTLVGNTVQWNVGSLAAGASKTVSVTMNVPSIGTIRNVATAKATCANPVSAEAGTEFAGIPAILLEVVDNPDPVEVGGQTTYTIIATNQGSLAGTNIRIVSTLEDEMAFVSAGGATNATVSGKTVTFAPLASLAPGASATWTVVVRAVADGDVRFTTQMTSDQLTRPVQENEATNFYR